jgi:acyl carrier protein
MATATSNPNASTLERLFAIIEKEYKIDTKDFTPETTLADTGLDSLSIADLLFEVEDVFEIKLDDMPPDQIPQKLSGLIALIDAQVAKTVT